jgi:hypothetical protein
MTCKLKRRTNTDLPTRKGEKVWDCEACGAVMFSAKKPRCREQALAEVRARHASAEAEADNLHLNDKVKPQ